jgi:hypothetical protein
LIANPAPKQTTTKMDPPQTRREKKGNKRKDPYNQKSIRIQERLREQIASTSSPQTRLTPSFVKHNEKKKPLPVGSSKTVFSKQEKTVSPKTV